MAWRKNARVVNRVIASEKMTVQTGRVWSDPNVPPMVKIEGKPCVRTTHSRDFCNDEEVVASITFRQGQFLFPVAYIHRIRKFYGETKDVRFIPGRGWAIYLDAVLRDKDGDPVILESGEEVDLSGWFLESSLKDAGIGLEPIKPGRTNPSVEDLARERGARLRGEN